MGTYAFPSFPFEKGSDVRVAFDSVLRNWPPSLGLLLGPLDVHFGDGEDIYNANVCDMTALLPVLRPGFFAFSSFPFETDADVCINLDTL